MDIKISKNQAFGNRTFINFAHIKMTLTMDTLAYKSGCRLTTIHYPKFEPFDVVKFHFSTGPAWTPGPTRPTTTYKPGPPTTTGSEWWWHCYGVGKYNYYMT